MPMKDDPTHVTDYIFESVGQPLHKQQHPLPPLRQGELLVAVEMTTICTSDLLTLTGKRKEPTPLILGHEIVGHIAALSEQPLEYMQGNILQLGDCISWSVFSAPADSSLAKQGIRQKSPDVVKYGHRRLDERHIFSRGMATHCHLLANTCIMKVSENIPLASICPVNCSLATVIGGVRLAGDLAERRVLITGGGMLGIYAWAVAHTLGGQQVIVVEPQAERREICHQFGAERCYPPEQNFNDLAGKFDISVDASGNLEAVQLGLNALDTGGTAVWLGAVYPQASLPVDTEMIVRRLLSIKGLHNYNEVDFKTAINFITQNYRHYPFEELVGKVFPLGAVEEAISFAKQHKPFRVAFQPGSA